MELLTDNYILIIVIVVVIVLMTIIGYIAEKTNFGKKEFSKRKGDKKETVKEEVKKPEEKPLPQTVQVPNVEPQVEEEPVEEFPEPEVEAVEMPKEEKEEVSFSDPLADDMEVSSDVLDTPYEAPREEVLSTEEDLNAPFGDEIAYEPPVENNTEDLNAPLEDYTVPNVLAETEEDLGAPLTDTDMMQEEDLNAPFGDEAKYPTREEFNLDLPDIDTIKEEVSQASNSESDDDDIWKF